MSYYSGRDPKKVLANDKAEKIIIVPKVQETQKLKTYQEKQKA